MHRFFQKYDVINHRLWAEMEQGLLTKAELTWRRFHDAFLLYGVDNRKIAETFGQDYLKRMIQEKDLMPGALEMLLQIEKNGGKMAIVSNGFREVQYHKLERSGISRFFPVIIISEEIGFHKPDPRIFSSALQQLSGIDPEKEPELWRNALQDTLMIGDDFENDIKGAMAFGIDQFFYNHKRRTDCPGATYESADLLPLV